ncbi:30S ribosomal protein S16 [Patescibacteria group bacterium]|nr:30S ribosomal protein S16 [Patescibacteria group bacterium]MBU4022753.1 30S ribosomal protein S16 [Patescibacteria group bacterium]MBU4078183.1 30S ribosomal protein S16 [Patescibacteria group bacterium]
MLAIRLLRIGRKHQPSYKIVAIDNRRAPKSGKFIEQLGFYNPLTKEKSVDKERVEYWLSVGAKASDTMHNLLVSEGIIKAEKRAVHSTKIKEKEETKSTVEKPAEEGEVAREEAKEEVAKEKPIEQEKKEEPKQEPKKEKVKEQKSESKKEELKKEESKEA